MAPARSGYAPLDASDGGSGDGPASGRAPTPEEQANPIAWWLMTWLNPYMRAGYERRLELEDAMGLAERNDGAVLYVRFQAAWAKELKRAEGARKPPSVLRAFWTVLGRDWCIQTVGNWVSVVLQLSGPVVCRAIVQFIEDSQTEAAPPLLRGLLLCGLLLVLQAADALVKGHAMFVSKLTGLRIRNLMVVVTFMSSLTLTQHSLQQQSTGKLVNQIAGDSQRFLQIMPSFSQLFLAPLQLVGAGSIIYSIIGWPIFIGIFLLFLYTPVGKKIAVRQKAVQQLKMRKADSRLKLFNEVVQGIKVIKLYA